MPEITKEFLENLKEDVHTELKKAENRLPQSFWETYSSFGNTDGGTIYLGVEEGSPKNAISGIKDVHAVKNALWNDANNKEKVSVNLLSEDDVQEIDVEKGVRVLSIRIRKATIQEKPVYLNGNPSLAYLRQADGDYSAEQGRLDFWHDEKEDHPFESRINPYRYGAKDIDKASLQEYRKALVAYAPDSIYKSLDDEEFLKAIGALIPDGQGNYFLSNAAVLFFGQRMHILQIYPHYLLDYQDFVKGDFRWRKRISSDDQDYNPNLFNFTQRVLQELYPSLPNPFYLEGGPSNVNGEDMKKAVRECLVNALCNASYALGGVLIRKEGSKILFRNDGLFPIPLPLALSGGHSDARNKQIQIFFRLIGYSHGSGQGLYYVNRVMDRYHYPKATIEENGIVEQTEVSLLLVSSRGEGSSKKAEILSLLASQPDGLPASEMEKQLKIPQNALVLLLHELMQEGLIRSNGKKTKGKRYLLV